MLLEMEQLHDIILAAAGPAFKLIGVLLSKKSVRLFLQHGIDVWYKVQKRKKDQKIIEDPRIKFFESNETGFKLVRFDRTASKDKKVK
jgi:hypothetical protein